MSWGYNSYRTGITCCRDCDRRQPGCHDTCPLYQKQRQQWEETKRKAREERRADRERR